MRPVVLIAAIVLLQCAVSLAFSLDSIRQLFGVEPEYDNSYYRRLQVGGVVEIIFPVAIASQFSTAFINSASFWNVVIQSSGFTPLTLSSAFSVKGPSCGVDNDFTFAAGEVIDKLFILAEVVTIDGPSGTLGRATSCYFLDDMPVIGYMQFDVDDLQNLANNGGLEAVIKHEMGHVIGIGTLWGSLVANPCTTFNPCNGNPTYTGANGVEGHADLGGTGNPLVANTNGPGTANAHWRESTYQSELMTGFLSSGFNALSIMSVKSLIDIGYTVDLATAESYTIPGVSPPPPSPTTSPPTANPTTASPTEQPTLKPGSCDGRCGEPFDANSPFCYCDSQCADFNDCCPDIATFCSGSPPATPTESPAPRPSTSPSETPTTSAPSTVPTSSPTFIIDLGDDVIETDNTTETETDLRKLDQSVAGTVSYAVVIAVATVILFAGIGFVGYRLRVRSKRMLLQRSLSKSNKKLPQTPHYEVKMPHADTFEAITTPNPNYGGWR